MDIEAEKIKHKAKRMFKNGMTMKEISEKLDIKPSTLRSWKKRYYWDMPEKKRPMKNVNPETNPNATRRCDRKTKIAQAEELTDCVVNMDDLTDRQQLFCLYFINSFNATSSYMKAYECDRTAAQIEGWKLKNNPRIAERIDELKRRKYAREYLSSEDVMQKYIDIAYADITDYVDITRERAYVKDPEEGLREIQINRVTLKEGTQVDGTIITEISQGRDGIKIKLADKMAALKFIRENLGMLTPEQKARVTMYENKNNMNVNVTGDNLQVSELLAHRKEVLEKREAEDMEGTEE